MGMYLWLLGNGIAGSLIDFKGIKVNINGREETFGRFFWWVLTIAFLIMGLIRHPELGFDGESYFRDYYRAANGASLGALIYMKDPAFYVIVKILTLVGSSYTLMRAMLYLCSFLPVAIYIYKKSNNICFSYSIYVAANYLSVTYGILRQSVAISFCLLAWLCAKESKRVLSLALIAVAALVHTSAAFWVLPFFILNIKDKKIRYKIEGAVLLSIVLYNQTFLGRLAGAYLGGRYTEIDSAGHGGYQLLAYVIIALITAFFLKYIDRGEDTTFFEINLWIIVIQVLAYQISIFGRMNHYLWIIYAVEFTRSGMKKKNQELLAGAVLLIMSTIYIYILLTDSGIMVPYRTLFAK